MPGPPSARAASTPCGPRRPRGGKPDDRVAPGPVGAGLQSDRCAHPPIPQQPPMTAALGLVAPLLLATTKKTTSSASPTLFIFIAIAAAFYFLIYRPQQRKAKMAREVTKNFDVGDEVLTAGGIVGHIIDIDGDRVTLETSVGASFVVLKQYVLRKLEEPGSTDAGDLPDAGELPDDDEH